MQILFMKELSARLQKYRINKSSSFLCLLLFHTHKKAPTAGALPAGSLTSESKRFRKAVKHITAENSAAKNPRTASRNDHPYE